MQIVIYYISCASFHTRCGTIKTKIKWTDNLHAHLTRSGQHGVTWRFAREDTRRWVLGCARETLRRTNSVSRVGRAPPFDGGSERDLTHRDYCLCTHEKKNSKLRFARQTPVCIIPIGEHFGDVRSLSNKCLDSNPPIKYRIPSTVPRASYYFG